MFFGFGGICAVVSMRVLGIARVLTQLGLLSDVIGGTGSWVMPFKAMTVMI